MRFAVFIIVMSLVLSQAVFSKTLHIKPNELSTLNLQDGDEIVLDSMPFGWGISRIVLGLNSVPSIQLSGRIVVDNCVHSLHDYYEQVDFPYKGNPIIKYYGPSQKLPIQWWVDSSPVTSSCESVEGQSRKDSVVDKIYGVIDSIYHSKIAWYKDLGTLNTEYVFKGSSEHFKITSLPDWFFNQVYVQIEPLDGRQLNGAAYSGDKKAKIEGWNTRIVFSPEGGRYPAFELAFPEYRKIKIKWWVAAESPRENPIPRKVENIGIDTISVTYDFPSSPYARGKVNLHFSRNVFADGEIPTIKKLSFNPVGSPGVDKLALMGAVYDIQAKLIPGDSVTLAIPLDFNYVPGVDSVFVGHYMEAQGKWVEEPVDSIVDNIAYFKAGSFSFRSLFRKATKVVNTIVEVAACPACAVVAYFTDNWDIYESTASKWSSVQMALIDGSAIDFVQDLMIDLACFNFDDAVDKFKRLGTNIKNTFMPPSSSEWKGIDQGILSQHIKDDDAYVNALTGFVKDRNLDLSNLLSLMQESVCESLNNYCMATSGQKCDCDSEGEQLENEWKITISNLDILLADAVLEMALPDYDRRYTFAMDGNEMYVTDNTKDKKWKYSDILKTDGGMLEDASWVVAWLKSCYGTFNLTGTIASTIVDTYSQVGEDLKNLKINDACSDMFSSMGLTDAYRGLFNYANNAVTCFENPLSGPSALNNLLSGHVNKLLKMSEVMVRVSLLSYIDKTEFRKYAAVAYKSVYDGTRAWLDLAGPLMERNNVVIKAYASLALFEYMNYGTMTNLNMVNLGLSNHYGDNGGFSEGTGYSQYIWDDVTYILASLKDAYQKNEGKSLPINGNFLKSPDYMLEYSRPVKDYGMIPVEVDDGCTYTPDYRVWSKLKDDAKYLAWSEAMPLKPTDGKINALVAFGYPDDAVYGTASQGLPVHSNKKLWGSFKDGLSMITAVSGGGDTVALSMVAEEGRMLERGQSHDQQDNLSITLASKNKGFLIQDRGYAGFDKRDASDGFHRYHDHNVLTVGNNCENASPSLTCIDKDAQPDNQMIGISAIRDRLENFSGDITGVGWSVFSFFISSFNIGKEYFSVDGGYKASLVGSIVEPESGVIGYSAQTFLLDHYKQTQESNYTGVSNTRSILYFGGSLWVIDQPSEKGLVWLANSPIGGDKDNLLTDNNVNLYGSEESPVTDAKGIEVPIFQEGARGDYSYDLDERKYYLKLYWYAIQDEDAPSYVMNYAVDDEGFSRNSTKCIAGFQCFRNARDTKRLVVPTNGTKYEVAKVLGNSYRGYAETDGILLAERAADGVWDYRVLNGKTYGEKRVKYLPSTMKLLLLPR